MRISLFLALVCGIGLLAGSTCLPLVDNSYSEPLSPTQLGIALSAPSTSVTVGQGDVVRLTWTATNTTLQPAQVTLLTESRHDLTRTVLVDSIEIQGGALTQSSSWNTTEFAQGTYSLVARIATPSDEKEAYAPGRITVDEEPTFEFITPASDVDVNAGETYTIEFHGGDASGEATVQLGLDPDEDDPTHDSGNEVVLGSNTLSAQVEDGSVDFVRDETADLDAGTYVLYAIVDDGFHDPLIVDAEGRVTITAADDEEEDTEFGIIEPAENSDFLTSTDTFAISYGVNQFDDVRIDLKIDTDDDHNNGNEVTILSQQLITAGTERETFDWDGTDDDDAEVASGIYRVFAVMNTGDGTPDVQESPGLIYRRTDEDQPLIGLLEPASATTVTAGEFLIIRWRDSDPAESATITLTYDDDPRPGEDEPGAEDDIAEVVILENFDASGGGADDSYPWQIPGSLPPGTYYIFAYIDGTPDTPDPDSQSVAPAPVILRDPAEQN